MFQYVSYPGSHGSAQAWSGPRDVYEQQVWEEQRVIHLRTLDNGLAELLGFKEHETVRSFVARSVLAVCS